ncbi:butyrophilin subfamily 2 member A2-like [Sinocyclocheilus rhinocerous]|uniref:butyrophilin subfamily 2 member A2-like n=1 Tax=Sinocyclocheilus rhinocerous TaxID=307959 RepID=UPI0007B87870|nr:PREDICTED: butyrophilin subfamily 2 member A2-like [Sinocyclocheilus rhinocerous]
MMEEQQKAAEKQEEELIEELEQEITELKMRNTELEQLSHTEDHLHLLQVYSSLCSPRNTRNWPEISMKTHESLETLRRALTQLKDTTDEKLTQTVSTELKWMQQNAVDVTLDPDTVHPDLTLSDDGKQFREYSYRDDCSASSDNKEDR